MSWTHFLSYKPLFLCAGLLLGADGGLLQVRLSLAAECRLCNQPRDVRACV